MSAFTVQKRSRGGSPRFCEVGVCTELKPSNTMGARAATHKLRFLDYQDVLACDICIKALIEAYEDNGGSKVTILPYKQTAKVAASS